MKKIRSAFTMIELLVVIVILGIIAKFGTELLLRTYEDFVFGTTNNRLLSQSESAVTQIANRLQYRIRESLVVRQGGGAAAPITTAVDAAGGVVFEWIGYDIDGMRGHAGNSQPTWSGFIDLSDPGAGVNTLVSPGTNWADVSAVISSLSPRGFNGTGAALFFVGDENINVNTGFAWDGVALADQSGNLHPIQQGVNANEFAPSVGTFGGTDVYEFYRLAWTAYALELFVDADGRQKLRLWYDYRPWLGESYQNNGQSAILMEDVTSIAFATIGDTLKVQVCITDNDIFGNEGAPYSVCKEKTIF